MKRENTLMIAFGDLKSVADDIRSGRHDAFVLAASVRAIAEEVRSAARALGTAQYKGEASKPAEGVRPPGETLWLAHGAMFGSASGDWDDLDLIDKLRWASVEDSAVRNLMAQSNTTPPARGRGQSDG